MQSNHVFANICKLELYFKNNINEFKYHEKLVKSLEDYDVVMMRQDPPFNMAYITATHILEKLPNLH